MPTPKQNRFTSYEFTEQEYKAAIVFSPLQKMYLQTTISDIAQQMLNLDAGDKSDIMNFELQRAYLKGQIECLEHIIQVSSTMEIDIKEEEDNKQYVVYPQSSNLFDSNFNSDEGGN